MDIREYLESDRQPVIDLWIACGLVVPHNNPGKDIDRKLAVGREFFLVGSVDGVVVASVMGGYEGHRGWVNYLAVNPGCRGRGYAREIMAQLELRLLEQGCPKLNLQIRATNQRMVDFYRALGYREDPVISMGKRLIPDQEPSQ